MRGRLKKVVVALLLAAECFGARQYARAEGPGQTQTFFGPADCYFAAPAAAGAAVGEAGLRSEEIAKAQAERPAPAAPVLSTRIASVEPAGRAPRGRAQPPPLDLGLILPFHLDSKK
jgi:hypothetical protein